VSADIAVVDDEEVLCEILAEVLREEGYSACAFISPQACLTAMTAGFRPRLIFVDLRMGGLDGAEFVRRVRAGRPAAEVHIYVVSGSVHPGDYPPRSSIQGVIGKPFNLEQILRIAADRLGVSRSGDGGEGASGGPGPPGGEGRLDGWIPGSGTAATRQSSGGCDREAGGADLGREAIGWTKPGRWREATWVEGADSATGRRPEAGGWGSPPSRRRPAGDTPTPGGVWKQASRGPVQARRPSAPAQAAAVEVHHCLPPAQAPDGATT